MNIFQSLAGDEYFFHILPCACAKPGKAMPLHVVHLCLSKWDINLFLLLSFCWHMPHGNHHAQPIASNGGQREDKNLLQRSQLQQHGEFRQVSISERQRSYLYGLNLCGAFIRAVLAMNFDESDRAMVADRTAKRL